MGGITVLHTSIIKAQQLPLGSYYADSLLALCSWVGVGSISLPPLSKKSSLYI